jgi:hypothetical protein
VSGRLGMMGRPQPGYAIGAQPGGPAAYGADSPTLPSIRRTLPETPPLVVLRQGSAMRIATRAA